MWPGNLANDEEDVNHGLYAQAHFCGCTHWQGEAALTEGTLWELLSVCPVHWEHTHSEPGKDLTIPWGHDSTSEWQGQEWGTKTRLILLMSMWLHQVPQGLRVVSVECEVHHTVLTSLKDTTALEPFPVCRGLWFALWPHGSSLAVPIVLYRVKKVLHPNNVN